ncbi:MAG TPA: DUF3488 and transglutaminase-like domain-containing protein [Bryobacteraceae bacterium]|nr:DUF3488 and transglutaminase-like domain-containing protein [Bryobacteraceae bacterium]
MDARSASSAHDAAGCGGESETLGRARSRAGRSGLKAAPAPLQAAERYFQFSLLGLLGTGYLAIASSGLLDGLAHAAGLAALVLRAVAVAGWTRGRLTAHAAGALTFAALVLFPIDYLWVSASLPQSVLHLTFVLAGLKLVTASTNRDYAYLRAFATAELLVAAMIGPGPSFFGFLVLFLLFTVSTFAGGEIRRSSVAPGATARTGLRFFKRRLAVLSLALSGGIVTLTGGMFFVLPRTARATIGRFGASRYHLPGFTREIHLSEIGKIKQSSRPVLHARAYGGERLDGAYWRGGSLSRFDGKAWLAPPGGPTKLRVDRGVLELGRSAHPRAGREVAYRVELEEIAADTLFFAGSPETININLREVYGWRGGSMSVPRLPNGIGYSVYSFFEDGTAPARAAVTPLPENLRQDLLQLPAALDPRISALAQEMTQGAETDEERARLLERRLRHDYSYTLDLPSKPVIDPLADFLFVRKKGHCEYFASAMAVMLRTLGIPSRVAIGFLGGSYNALTGWQVVRASDAHSWVEAWLPSSGWTRFDPTPPDPHASSGEIAARIAMLSDAADQFWQNWVVSYDLPHQSALASRIERATSGLGLAGMASWLSAATGFWRDAGRPQLMWAALGLVAAAIVVAPLWRVLRTMARRRAGVRRLARGEGQASDATMLYQRMLTLLERRGFRKPACLTPAEFARALPMSEISILVEDLTSAYNEFRFGGRSEVAPRMMRLLERLQDTPSAPSAPRL